MPPRRFSALPQPVWVLWRTMDRKRLLRAYDVARQHGLKALLAQLMIYISYHQQDREAAVPTNPAAGVPPAEPHVEDAWPADRPLVSVVIPCFNYGAFVAEAVDSVLAQTLHDLEIIVVEGGSTDGITPSVLRALHRPRTTVLFRDERHRAGDNRNFGIRHAKGRYICCLDADDKLRPTYLEKAVFLLEQSGYDVVSTSVRRFGAVEETYGVLPAPDLSALLQLGNHVTTCAVFRRVLWEEAGGYQDSAPGEVQLHEDWRFWIRLASLGARFRNVCGEHLFLYRAHSQGSLSGTLGKLPSSVQSGLLREAEGDRITEEALARSRDRASLRLRAAEGPRNLLVHGTAGTHGRTVVLAMPFLVLGGAERLLSEILKNLRKAGYRLIVATTVQAGPEHGDTTAWFEPATDEIYHLPRFLAQHEWDDFIDYVIAAKRCDVLWIVGSTVFYEALARLRARFPSLRVVDLLFNTIGHTACNRRHARLIDLTLVENEEVRRWLLSHGEAAERICMIPSGIDLDYYTPALRSRRMAESLGIDSGCFVVGFSGRLAHEKAPLTFLEIARRLASTKSMRFVITGAGPMERQVHRAVTALRPAGRVHFLGMVPDVRDCLACYDVLVVPSELDGRPTAVLEALAMGIPVIASAVGGLPELVRDGETGFLCRPGDVAGFARAIARLQAAPLLHGRMRTAARQFAERELSLDRMIASYTAAFETLFDGAHEAPPP